MFKKTTNVSILYKFKPAKAIFALLIALGRLSCSEMEVQQAIDIANQINQELGGPTSEDFIKGVKDTLSISGSRASETLSKVGGFSNSELYRIAMPQDLQKISGTLRTFGLGKQVDIIEQHMNKGAELASAEAKQVFLSAITSMSVEDALGILRGGDNAATDYFRRTTESTLRGKYTPIVEQQLSKLGFYNDIKQFRSIYDSLNIKNKPSLDLEKHVVDKSLTAIFDQFSKQEASIRQDPLKKGSEFLGKIYEAARAKQNTASSSSIY